MPVRLAFATAILLLTLAVGPAQAAPTKLTVRGAGFGHGVGMSQYGAYGFALEGSSYRQILSHYYSGTSLGSAGSRTVRVLVGQSSTFVGATRAAGRRARPGTTYRVRARGGSVDLLSSTGRRLRTVPAPLRVTSPGILTTGGKGYRGALEFRPAGGGVNAINALPMDEYVQGVVALESPSTWPAEALKAQAVAARTYALTTNKPGDGFEQYADTRSQVYGGVGAEQATTNAATQATAGQLVTYEGRPVATYFFSTSGGRTENVETSALGTTPQPWLRSVEDEYDDVSPRHRWTSKMSMKSAAAKLRGLYRGRFRGVKVVSRGASPRIMQADVIGTAGRTRVSGATLRAELGLYDSWAYFQSITTGKAPKPLKPGPVDPATPMVARVPAVAGLRGTLFPAKRGAMVKIERRFHGRWIAAGSATVRSGGRYHAGVTAPGLYRVRFQGHAGPGVRIR